MHGTIEDPEVRQVPVGMELEDNYGAKVRIGLIALCDDLAVDRDFARMVPDDRVGLVTSRIFLEQPNSPRTFMDMADRIPGVVRLLCPLLRLDAVVFGCTSATSVIGAGRVAAIIQNARPGVKATNPATGAASALRALGARRVSVITPYTVANTGNVVRFLKNEGCVPTQVSCFGFDTDMGIGSVPAVAYLELARSTDHRDADAIFVSCTATKALDAIEDIESATGLPCITSNQAAFWHALTLTGWSEPIDGYGRLMKECWT
ncbi:MAG: Asp/Glu/hydantoin racemase [Pseudomonadota bacterium]|nr:Asp/Glu/hydantoin racemase [Pseudomonadota bacterium]